MCYAVILNMPCLGGEKPRVFQVRILLLDSTELHYDIKVLIFTVDRKGSIHIFYLNIIYL